MGNYIPRVLVGYYNNNNNHKDEVEPDEDRDKGRQDRVDDDADDDGNNNINENPFFYVKYTPEYGNAAYAKRDLEPGEVILREDPLLVWSHLSRDDHLAQSRLGRLFAEHNIEFAGVFDLICAFALAPAAVQRRFLGEFYCPSGKPLEYTRAIASKIIHEIFGKISEEELRQLLPGVPQEVFSSEVMRDVDLMARVLLISNTNCHDYGNGMLAAFHLGSKVSHSCSPNLAYHPIGGQLTYTVIKPIPRDTMLSFSYLGSVPLMKSTVRRRAHLQYMSHFFCMCERCTADDESRVMLCPAHEGCNNSNSNGNSNGNSNNNTATSAVAIRSDVEGLAFFAHQQQPYDPSEAEAMMKQQEVLAWKCTSCGRKFRDIDMPLDKEMELEKKVLLAYENTEVDEDLLYECIKVLGKRHWATALITKLVADGYITTCIQQQQEGQQQQQQQQQQSSTSPTSSAIATSSATKQKKQKTFHKHRQRAYELVEQFLYSLDKSQGLSRHVPHALAHYRHSYAQVWERLGMLEQSLQYYRSCLEMYKIEWGAIDSTVVAEIETKLGLSGNNSTDDDTKNKQQQQQRAEEVVLQLLQQTSREPLRALQERVVL